jgi:subtilisin family serine protease
MLGRLVSDAIAPSRLGSDLSHMPLGYGLLGYGLLGEATGLTIAASPSLPSATLPSLAEFTIAASPEERLGDDLFPSSSTIVGILGGFAPPLHSLGRPVSNSSSALAPSQEIELGAAGAAVLPQSMFTEAIAPLTTELSPPLKRPSPDPTDPTAANLQALIPLASYLGELTEQDDYNPDRFDTFKDDYVLNVAQAGKIQCSLTARDFDPYLQILRESSGEVLASDDDSGEGRNALINLDVVQGDRFIVRATSYDRGAQGTYRLSLNRFSTEDDSQPSGSDNHSGSPEPPPEEPVLVDGNVQPNPEQFRTRSGYGLVNAAMAVAASLNLADPNRTQPFPAVTDLGGNNQGLDRIQVPEVWAQGFTGTNIVVAVVDSGLDITHPELQNSLWINPGEIAGDGIDNDNNGYVDDLHGWNFGRDQLNNQIDPGTDSPFQGHGTHVAGIIAGANDDQGNTGVAYNAKIMALRLGDTNNTGIFLNAGDLSLALRYAVDNGAQVINLSLGWSDTPSLRSALEYAASKNVVVVSASGNKGFSTPVSPARYAIDWGISVGAVTQSGTLATFSNGAGTNPDIRHVLAPGYRIVSAEPGGGYQTRTGTSMAAPYVSGVVALMLSANPNLTQAQVRDILAGTAVPLEV